MAPLPTEVTTPSEIATSGVPFFAKMSIPLCFLVPPPLTAPQKLPILAFVPTTGKTIFLLIDEAGKIELEEIRMKAAAKAKMAKTGLFMRMKVSTSTEDGGNSYEQTAKEILRKIVECQRSFHQPSFFNEVVHALNEGSIFNKGFRLHHIRGRTYGNAFIDKGFSRRS
jgi:hypothetical protein